MKNIYNKNLVPNSQNLRKNMTDEEKHLWYDFLKFFPVPVHRQRVIHNYIVDFFIASKKIVIELDGSQHGNEENRFRDKTRDEVLKNLGITVLRYTNNDINSNFDSVCRDIMKNAGVSESEYMTHKKYIS